MRLWTVSPVEQQLWRLFLSRSVGEQGTVRTGERRGGRTFGGLALSWHRGEDAVRMALLLLSTRLHGPWRGG